MVILFICFYYLESSEDQTKINYETSLRKYFKIETIDKVMDKRSDLVKESSEGEIEELNIEMKNSVLDRESTVEMVKGSDEVVEIAELCKKDEEVIGEHIDPKDLEPHGEQVELYEVQSKLSRRQLVVCCGSWKPVKNWSLPKDIGLMHITLHSQSNNTVTKATHTSSMPSVQKTIKLTFGQKPQEDLKSVQDYRHTCKHTRTRAIMTKQTSRRAHTCVTHIQIQKESSTECYAHNCATTPGILFADHFARDVLTFYSIIPACMHAINFLSSIINVHYFIKLGVKFYTIPKTVLIFNTYVVNSC